MNIGEILALAAHKYPEHLALVAGEKRFNFHEFNSRVNRMSSALLQWGLNRGDKVSVLLVNSHHFVELYFAVAKAGGVFVPVNFRSVGQEVIYTLNHSDARFFFFGCEFTQIVHDIRSNLTAVEFFIAVDQLPPAPNIFDYESVLGQFPDKEPEVSVNEQDECQILYTSGTTGKPKGAVLTHGNILWNLMNTILGREEKEGEVSLVIGPLYHAAPLNHHFTVRIAVPGTTILVKEFSPRQVMEAIEREKVTVISGAPAMYMMLLNLPGVETYDTRSVTKCTTGASILPEETKNRLLKLFPNVKGVYDVYGCTEASPLSTILKAEDSLRKQECVGRALPFLEVRIVDPNDREVVTGDVGELICRGPNVMKGYYKDPEATADTLRGGWLHTGDLGRMDKDGFIYIVDRKKDIIISGGENIYPREVEEVLFRHPKIRDVAIVGVADPLWGESVKAFIVLKEGAVLKEEDVVEYCKAHLASYKKPKVVRFVDSLPRNASGKVLKTVLQNEW